MRLLIFLLLVAGLSFSFSSCDNTINSNQDIVFPDSTAVSYAVHVDPFLRVTCTYYGCHSSETRAGGIVLDNYFNLMGNTIYGVLVIPGQPDASLLIQVLENRIQHSYAERWRINDNHRAGMRKWVLEGANNN